MCSVCPRGVRVFVLTGVGRDPPNIRCSTWVLVASGLDVGFVWRQLGKCWRHVTKWPSTVLRSAPDAARSNQIISLARTNFADGHTASNTPDLFRPPKLSGAGPG